MEISSNMNNWKIILAQLVNGPKSGRHLRKVLFETRHPGKSFHPHHHRGQYIWYFNQSPAWVHAINFNVCYGGLDYGYIKRISRGMYAITQKGEDYLNSPEIPDFKPGCRRTNY